MTEFVRIDTGNGRAASVSKSFYDGLAEKPPLIDADAVDVRGVPLADSRLDGRADKPRTSVAKKAAAKKTAAPKTTGAAASGEKSDADPAGDSNQGGVAADTEEK